MCILRCEGVLCTGKYANRRGLVLGMMDQWEIGRV